MNDINYTLIYDHTSYFLQNLGLIDFINFPTMAFLGLLFYLFSKIKNEPIEMLKIALVFMSINFIISIISDIGRYYSYQNRKSLVENRTYIVTEGKIKKLIPEGNKHPLVFFVNNKKFKIFQFDGILREGMFVKIYHENKKGSIEYKNIFKVWAYNPKHQLKIDTKDYSRDRFIEIKLYQDNPLLTKEIIDKKIYKIIIGKIYDYTPSSFYMKKLGSFYINDIKIESETYRGFYINRGIGNGEFYLRNGLIVKIYYYENRMIKFWVREKDLRWEERKELVK